MDVVATTPNHRPLKHMHLNVKIPMLKLDTPTYYEDVINIRFSFATLA